MRGGRRGVVVAVIGLAAASLIAGCGSSSSSTPSTPAAAESSASEAASSEPASSETASTEASTSAEATESAVPTDLPAPDMCALVTVDEIVSILGKEPGTGVAAATGLCEYDDIGLKMAVIPSTNYDDLLASAESDPEVSSVEDLDGVGERAVFVTQGTHGDAVVAQQGDYAAVVQAPANQEQLTALVALILGKLV